MPKWKLGSHESSPAVSAPAAASSAAASPSASGTSSSSHRRRNDDVSDGDVSEVWPEVYALVPKSIDNPFFDLARDGCVDEATDLQVFCNYVGPAAFHPDGIEQGRIIDELVDEGIVSGIAVSVVNVTSAKGPIARATEAGVAVVTFDSDAPGTDRVAYVGTDNRAFGMRLGLMLDRVAPLGGTYALVSGRTPNLQKRERAVRDALAGEGTKWTELRGGADTIIADNATEAVEAMTKLAEDHPRLGAIVPVMGLPMRDAEGWMKFRDEHRKEDVDDDGGMTLICGDTMPNQLLALDRDYVDGLVGQHPYEMGKLSLLNLWLLKRYVEVPPKVFGTSLVEAVRIPLNLPDVVVDYNYIGELRILGYVLFGITAVLALGAAGWTVWYRKDRVVMTSQPPFLLLITLGVFIFAATIIPLSTDDEFHTVDRASRACMSMFWLLSMGFTLVFSALFAKTWRVNRIFHHPNRFERLKVTVRDVIAPLVMLLTANVIVMVCWTVLSPLEFVREPQPGLDPWNRVISTYGTCQAENDGAEARATPYYVCLAVVNFVAVLIAVVQAYQARNVQTEYAESKYIALCMVSMLQTMAISIPVLALTKDPQARYVVMTLMVFLLSTAILSLIFVPKIVVLEKVRRKRRKDREEKERRREAAAAAAVAAAAEAAKTEEEETEPDDTFDDDDDDATLGLKLSVTRTVPKEVYDAEMVALKGSNAENDRGSSNTVDRS